MRRALAALAVATIALSGGCARAQQRPSGVAESWLQDVAKQGRPGIRANSEKRAAELGDPAVAHSIIPANPEPKEKYFSDLEVGRALTAGDGSKAQVPYRVTARTSINGKAGKAVKTGTLVLNRIGNGWRVVATTGPLPDLKVPSQGGPLPARAASGHWLLALLGGFVLTALSVVLVERQPRPGAV